MRSEKRRADEEAIHRLPPWFAMQASIYHAIDDELRDRVRGVAQFMDLQTASLSVSEIREEFREHWVSATRKQQRANRNTDSAQYPQIRDVATAGLPFAAFLLPPHRREWKALHRPGGGPHA